MSSVRQELDWNEKLSDFLLLSSSSIGLNFGLPSLLLSFTREFIDVNYQQLPCDCRTKWLFRAIDKKLQTLLALKISLRYWSVINFLVTPFLKFICGFWRFIVFSRLCGACLIYFRVAKWFTLLSSFTFDVLPWISN